VRHSKVFYEINREHPALGDLLTGTVPTARQVRMLLRLLEETVPVPMIAMDASEQSAPHAAPFDEAPLEEIQEIASHLYAILLERGLDPTAAREAIAAMEPFRFRPEALQALPIPRA
jgi:hypothetical protein